MTVNIIGKRFGILTVISKSTQKATSGSVYTCLCDCGKELDIARCSLVSGHTKSCGCTRNKYLAQCKPAKTHGYSNERLYKIWDGMKQRCYNPNNSRYELYGGRGITLCKEWSDSYVCFREWALAAGYDPNAARGQCTIDRINPDGIYEPQNCRWVNMHEQRINQRRMLP